MLCYGRNILTVLSGNYFQFKIVKIILLIYTLLLIKLQTQISNEEFLSSTAYFITFPNKGLPHFDAIQAEFFGPYPAGSKMIEKLSSAKTMIPRQLLFNHTELCLICKRSTLIIIRRTRGKVNSIC